ncbi:MAG TPA: acyltransferase [Acidobacteriaceae bacterium]|nr:acyltransferase [Acidobacteriaceae bacterium]
MSELVAGNTEHTAPANRVYFPALDGIRAAAFLLVFLQHYMWLAWGWSGVNFFFVLSGFLITGILIDTRDRPHRIRNFYVRRTLRIFPLYYGILLFLLLLTPLLHWRWSWHWLAWPLYLGNFLPFLKPTPFHSHEWMDVFGDLRGLPTLYLGHFWSLCVEEQFYLIWPWIVFRVRSTRTILWICAITVVADPLLRVLTLHHAPGWMLDSDLLYRATPFQLDSLLLGALLAVLWRGEHRRLLFVVARVVAVLCTIAAIGYLAATLHPTKPHFFSRIFSAAYVYPEWHHTWGLTFINVYAAALIVCALVPGSFAYRLFHLSGMRWVGRISYGAYVFHDIPHLLYDGLVKRMVHHYPWSARLDPRLLIPFIALVSTLLIARLSYRFFETPFLNLKERWTR